MNINNDNESTSPPAAAITIETAAIDGLTPDPTNARLHDQANIDAIARSLVRFGQQKPIVVDRSGVILAGNGTCQAAQQLGWTHLLVARTSLAGAEATAFALADNRTAELARWDHQQLGQTLADLRETCDADLQDATGFDEQRVTELLEQVGLAEVDQPPLRPIYQLVVDCEDESQQAARFAQLTALGFNVRAVNL